MPACINKWYGTNRYKDNYLHSNFFSQSTTNNYILTRKSLGYPKFAPTLAKLSTYHSISSVHTVVNIFGTNFLPNNTMVKFGGYYLPVIYNNSFNVAFIIPTDIVPGIYSVFAINYFNNSFSPQIKQNYISNITYSNKVTFSIL